MVTIHSITNVDGDSTKSYEFCGLSTDEKPTEVGGKPIEDNSLFLELDTGDFYYFDGEAWNALGTSGGGGGGDLNTVTATIVNNSDDTEVYSFYGYDFINDSLPSAPVLALQVKNGEYYAGTYSNEVSAGETGTAEILMLGDVFYFDANQNAQVTGDASIAWDDVVESYIITATGDFTLTYE